MMTADHAGQNTKPPSKLNTYNMHVDTMLKWFHPMVAAVSQCTMPSGSGRTYGSQTDMSDIE